MGSMSETACSSRSLPIISRHHGHLAVLLPSGPDSDLDVLAKGRQKFHKPADGETAGAVAHQQGHMWLLDAEHLCGLRLCESLFADEAVNLKRQPRLHHFLFGVR